MFREYVTFGNFNVTVTAFERLSLLMSDPGFNTFVMSAIIFSAVFWGANGFFAMLRSGRVSDWMQGIVIILIGAVVYLYFLVPKSDLLVFDEPSNRSMVVSQVPDGLILLAGMQNQVIRAAVNMIWTSSDPESYRQNARGDIFNILQSVFDNKSFVPSIDDSTGKNLTQSIERYFQDCVLFEIARPNSDININEFYSNASILDIFARAFNPAINTVYYDTAHPGGYTCSCADSYTSIEQSLNNLTEEGSTNQKFWSERCEQAGYYDIEGAEGDTALRTCQNKAVDFLSLYLTPGSSLNLMRQYLVSNTIFNYIKNNDVYRLADFKIMTGAYGEAATSLKWLPILKGVTFAVYLGLTPFLFILLPTLVFFRVVQFILGIFAFMVSWEICDALLHSYAMDMSIAAFREIFNNGLSLRSLWMMDGESYNALMIFGKMRWVSMILASTVSVVIARFGGTAMAHVASMINLGGYGAGAASEVNDPMHRSSHLNRLPQAAPTEAITNEHSWSVLQGQAYYQLESRVIGQGLIIDGHGGPKSAAQVAGESMNHGFLQQKNTMYGDQDTARSNDTRTDDILYDRARSSAERGFGAAIVDSQDDWQLAGAASSMGSLSEKASYLKNRMVDDIKRDGAISEYTQDNIKALTSIADGHMAFLNAPAVTSNLNKAEKENMKNWLKDNSYPVDSLGSQATLNFALDPEGRALPSGLTSFEGHRGSRGFNFAEHYGHSIDMPLTPDNKLWVYQNGELLAFSGGRLTGYQGGYHTIHDGVTSDGQLINGMIDPHGHLLRTSHPSNLEVSATSMLNMLSNNALPSSHINVSDNPGAAVQAWVSAVGTYAQKNGVDNSAWNWAVNGRLAANVGTPLGGVVGSSAGGGASASGGHSWNFSKGETENILAHEITQKLSSAENNQQKLEIMQDTFNGIIEQYSKAKENGIPNIVKKAYEQIGNSGFAD